MKHTALPWHVGGKSRHDAPLNGDLPRIWAGDRAGIADICTRRPIGSGVSSEEKANAAYIVQCCNAFPDLVAALKELITAEEEYGDPDNVAINQAWLRAKDALKKAGVE